MTPPGDDVHVWSFAPEEATPEHRARHAGWLSPEERARADAFRFERDRHRFVACHGILRGVLGRYLRRAPESLQFEVDPFGKPELAGEPRPLRFNLSHTRGRALIAVTDRRRVGVDVEQHRERVQGEQIAGRWFTPAETAAIRSSIDPSARFFAFWTRKEACIKALGQGLSFPLDRFDLAPLEAGRDGWQDVVLREQDPPYALIDLAVGPGFSGALAVGGGEGHPGQVLLRPLEELA